MPRRFAQSLMVRRAVRKVAMSGTNRRISSVTREPFKLRIHLSLKFFSRLLSRSCRSSGTRATIKRAQRRSICFHLCKTSGCFRFLQQHTYRNAREQHIHDWDISVFDGLKRVGQSKCDYIFGMDITCSSLTSGRALSISYMTVKK